MISYLKKLTKSTSKQPNKSVDKKDLFSTINLAMDNFAQETADESLNRLIAQTGKSRGEILQIILNDDEVESCGQDIESAIRATPFTIWGDDLDENTQNELIKVITPHIKTFISLAMLAKYNGYAIAEYVYKQDDTGRIVLDKVLSREGELDFYRFKTDGTVHFDKNAKSMMIDTTVKHLVLTHKATPTRPMGQMMIIKAYPAVLLRSKNWAYLGQFIKRYAQPYVVGKQGGFGVIESFTHRLFEFVSGGATGIGADDDISIHQLSADGTAFLMAERLANARIQKLLLGRVKTSELSNGSRASQETDDKTRIDRIGSYLELVKEAVQHALNAMLLVNEQFGVPIIKSASGQIWFDFKNEKAVDKIRAERDKLYLDTGTITLTKDYYKDVVGLEEHHFKIVEPTNAPQIPQAQNQPQNKEQDLPLSLLLSNDHNQDHSHEHNHAKHSHDLDIPLTDKQIQINQAKGDIIQSLLDDSTDFADFEKKLALLSFDNDEFISELAKQGMSEFLKGLSGVDNDR